jgi:zinc transporter, ZIP family
MYGIEINTLLFAFGLTLFAGLATGMGSAMAFFVKRTNIKFLSLALGFSAGVMIYVSFVEIFFKAREELTGFLGERPGTWVTVAVFFGGMLLIALIDRFIPKGENPHEINMVENMTEAQRFQKTREKKLMRMGMMTGLAIAIHNFPEGLATFTAAIADPNLGIAIAVAIAIHNIPEGIAISVPIYYATGSRRKAFKWSFLSGLAEPIGTIFGFNAIQRRKLFFTATILLKKG